ncbi:hypothetical protein [Luteolibacter sp. Populi]|uniref:hypothetical protein n=1 Tax=Luteolibacter sp. Populi TaxID=3230487 RepID=UPI003465F342
MKTALISAAIFASCLSAGWLAGQAKKPAPAGAAEAAADVKAAKSRRAPPKSSVPLEVTERLARIRMAKTPEERMRAIIHLAQTIPLGDIETWYDSEWINEGSEDMQTYLFYRTLRARWLASDPEGLVSYAMRKDSDRFYEISQDWAGKDPAAALAYLDKLKDPAKRARVASAIGTALAKADPQLVLSRIPELQKSLSPENSSTVSEMIRELAKSSPELLKAQSANWPDSLRDAVAQGLASASLKRNLASGIAELSRTQDGKRFFKEALQNNSELMKEIAKDPGMLPPGWLGAALEGAGGYYLVQGDPQKWLSMDLSGLALTSQQTQQIRSQAISTLGSKNVDRLMELFGSGDLDESQRRSAIYALGQNLPADKKAAWLASLTDQNEIDMAKQAVASRSSRAEGKTATPSTLLADLGEGETAMTWQQTRAAISWDREQMKSLVSEFAALPGEQKSVVAKKLVESNYSDLPVDFRAQAIGYLIANPEPKPENGTPQEGNRQLTQKASDLASRWAEEDPAAASKWVASLPAGDERLWAAKNLAARWSDYEPAAAERWLAALPSAERKQVQEFLESGQAKH